MRHAEVAAPWLHGEVRRVAVVDKAAPPDPVRRMKAIFVALFCEASEKFGAQRLRLQGGRNGAISARRSRSAQRVGGTTGISRRAVAVRRGGGRQRNDGQWHLSVQIFLTCLDLT